MTVRPRARELGSGAAGRAGLSARARRFGGLLLVLAAAGLLQGGWIALPTAPLRSVAMMLAGAAGLAYAVSTQSRDESAPGPMGAADLAFLAALLAALYTVYFHALGRFPAVASDYEGDIAMTVSRLGKTSYRALDTDVQPGNRWPTVLHYQTYLATRLFGWTPAVLRSVSAGYGALAAVALFLLARRRLGLAAAALAGGLLALNPLHAMLSRRLYTASPTVLLGVVALYFILQAFDSGRKRDHFLGGLACGLMLHFYHVGKMGPVLLLLWYAWMALFHRGRLRWQQAAVAGAGVVLAALPIIYSELRHPGDFMQWPSAIGLANPAKPSLLKAMAESVPLYLGIWGHHGSPHVEDGPPSWPVMQAWAAWMGLAGLALALFSPRKPLSAALLLLFLVGILPALPGGNAVKPCTRRAILAVPAVCLAAGYFLHGAQAALRGWLPRLGAAAAGALAAAVLLLSWGYQRNFSEEHAANTVLQCYTGAYEQSLLGALAHADPAREQRVDFSYLQGHPQWRFYLPLEARTTAVRGPEEAFYAAPTGLVLALRPSYWAFGLMLKDQVPGAAMSMRPWTHVMGLKGVPLAAAHFVDDMRFGAVGIVQAPAEGLAAVRGLWSSKRGRLKVFDAANPAVLPAELGEVSGWLWLGREAGPLEIVWNGPGGELSLNGGPWSRKTALPAAYGILPFKLRLAQGMPAGPWPLTVRYNGKLLQDEGRVLAFQPFSAWRVGLRGGEPKGPGPGQAAWSQQTPVAAFNPFYPRVSGFAAAQPYTLVLENRLTAPEDGDYRFDFIEGRGQIYLDGKRVRDVVNAVPAQTVRLKKGQRFTLRSETWSLFQRLELSNVSLGVAVDGKGLRPLPWTWQRQAL